MGEVEPISPEDWPAFIEGKIAKQNNRDLKFLLRQANKYSGMRKADARPRKFARYVHLAGGLSVKNNRENREDDDESNDKDGLRRIRKLFKQDPSKFGDIDELLEKAHNRLQRKLKEKEEKGDDQEEDDGEESEDWC